MKFPKIKVLQVGVMSFQKAVKLQKSLANELYLSKNISNDIAGTLVLLEHTPTYTTGIRNRSQYVSDEMHLRKLGADFCMADRGGLVTFHGPGQLVAYPVIDLRKLGPGGLRLHVARLEATGIQLCQNSFNLSEACAEPHPATGVWIGENKICAIGVRGSRQITMHGISINCSTDLSWFSHIIPCGLENRGVTSLSHELGRQVSVEETIPHFLTAFCSVFQCMLCEYPKLEADKIYFEDSTENTVAT